MSQLSTLTHLQLPFDDVFVGPYENVAIFAGSQQRFLATALQLLPVVIDALQAADPELKARPRRKGGGRRRRRRRRRRYKFQIP